MFNTIVQAVIYDALVNDAPLMAKVVGVYDDVPQNPNQSAFPYVVIGEDNFTNTDTDTELMSRVSIPVHVWSRYTGRKETKEIQDLIYDVLHRAELSATNYNFVTITEESSTSFFDADGVTRHGVQTFNLLIERV